MNKAFFAVVTIAVLAAAVPAGAQFYMELQEPTRTGIPADCSTWHELYPAFCTPHHQDFYSDNGDGVMSACDEIVLDCTCYHIDWVGPTYVLDYVGQISYWEPVDPVSGDPTCQTWHQVHPEFCQTGHVDMWDDMDQSGSVTPCDFVTIAGLVYHVADVNVNIRVSPTSPVEQASWGRIKGLFSTF